MLNPIRARALVNAARKSGRTPRRDRLQEKEHRMSDETNERPNPPAVSRLPVKRNGGGGRRWLLPSLVAAAAIFLLLRRRRGRKQWWEEFADANGPQIPRPPDG